MWIFPIRVGGKVRLNKVCRQFFQTDLTEKKKPSIKFQFNSSIVQSNFRHSACLRIEAVYEIINRIL